MMEYGDRKIMPKTGKIFYLKGSLEATAEVVEMELVSIQILVLFIFSVEHLVILINYLKTVKFDFFEAYLFLKKMFRIMRKKRISI